MRLSTLRICRVTLTPRISALWVLDEDEVNRLQSNGVVVGIEPNTLTERTEEPILSQVRRLQKELTNVKPE